jgi:predicted metalloprotease
LFADVLVVWVLLALYCRLLTVPIFMKSLLTVINMESFFPVVLSIAAGVWSFRHR